MRVLTSSLAIVTLATAVSSSAFAAEDHTATGIVKAISHKTMTLTLKNGNTYILPPGFKDPGLKRGERVTIAYETMGKKHEAKSVTIVQ